jgi:hypothetical protein
VNGCLLNQFIGPRDPQTRIYMPHLERHIWIPARWALSQRRIVQQLRRKTSTYHLAMMITQAHGIQWGEGRHVPARFIRFIQCCQRGDKTFGDFYFGDCCNSGCAVTVTTLDGGKHICKTRSQLPKARWMPNNWTKRPPSELRKERNRKEEARRQRPRRPAIKSGVRSAHTPAARRREQRNRRVRFSDTQ